MYRVRITTRIFQIGLLSLLLAGCIGSGRTVGPDDQYGHRFDETTPEGQLTVLIQAPSTDIGDYEVQDAVFDTVHVRPGPVQGADDRVSVEVLVKGALPDGCTELHDLKQTKGYADVTVELSMRRRRAEVCTQAVRPYRFYFVLPGDFGVGGYKLHVNDRTFPFRVVPGI